MVFQAWEEDPLDTLKLIAHMRDVRDGKADRDLFHDCIAWLWQEHPLTLLANLEEIVKVATMQQHAAPQTCFATADVSCFPAYAVYCDYLSRQC